MPVSVSVYNQAASVFAQGLVNSSGSITQTEEKDNLAVALYTAATFTATDTSMLALTGPPTEAPANGTYVQFASGQTALSNITVTQTGNDATIDADDYTVTAGASPLSAVAAILYRKQTTVDAVDRPLLFINFDATETAAAGTDFKIVWSGSGIFSFVVT